MKRFTYRWRVIAGLVGVVLLLAACGGDEAEDVLDEIGSAVEDATAGENGDGSASGGDDGGDSGGDGAGGSGGLTGGSAPEGTIEIGETYTVEVDPAAAPWSLDIPAGSITTIAFEAAADNTAGASLMSTDFSVSVFAEPGGAAEDVPAIITAHDGGMNVTLSVTGVAGDVVSFKVDSQAQPDAPDGGDAPDIITDAIAIDGQMSGLLGGEDLTDYYTVDVAAGAVVALEVTALPTDSFGSVSASLEFNGERRSGVSAQPGGTEAETLVTSNDEGGTWYVRVDGAGEYTIDVGVDPQTDGGGVGDAGDDASSATAVEPGTFAGLMGDADSTDFYEFDLPDSAAVEITLRNDPTSASSVNARILVNGKEEVRVGAAAGGTETDRISLSSEQSGTAIIEVWGGDATYEIDLSVGQQQDGGTPGDAGDDEASAKRIEDPTSPWSGQMSADDSSDFYVLTIDELGPIVVTLESAADASANVSARVLIGGREQGRTNAAPG